MGGRPCFPLGPSELMSWISRGLSWGPAKDVPILQSRIQDLFNGDFSLVAVIQAQSNLWKPTLTRQRDKPQKVLNDTRSLRIELPQAKRPACARLDLTDQHNLYHRNQTELSIEEISGAALQYRHVLGWPPAQTSADP